MNDDGSRHIHPSGIPKKNMKKTIRKIEQKTEMADKSLDIIQEIKSSRLRLVDHIIMSNDTRLTKTVG